MIDIIQYKFYIFVVWMKKEGNVGLFFEIELIFICYLCEICSDRVIILGNALLQSVCKFGV